MRVTHAGADDVHSVPVTVGPHLPASTVGVAVHPRERWGEPHDMGPDAHHDTTNVDCQRSGGQTTAAERDAHVGSIEALCLPPPPSLGEPGTPVLLRAHLSVGELPRLATDESCAARLAAEQVRVPVLAEKRHRREQAPTTEGERPLHGSTQREVGPRVAAEVDVHLRGGRRDRPVTRFDAELIRRRVCTVEHCGADEPARVSGDGDGRPVSVRVPVDAAEHHKHASVIRQK